MTHRAHLCLARAAAQSPILADQAGTSVLVDNKANRYDFCNNAPGADHALIGRRPS